MENEEIVAEESQAVKEEEDEDIETRMVAAKQKPINTPSVRRVIARARSPLQLTQERLQYRQCLTPEIVELLDNDKRNATINQL